MSEKYYFNGTEDNSLEDLLRNYLTMLNEEVSCLADFFENGGSVERLLEIEKDKSIKAHDYQYRILRNIGVINPDRELPFSSMGSFHIEEDGELIHFVFDELLPPKLELEYNIPSKKQKYLRDQLVSDYYSSLIRESSHLSNDVYDGKPKALLFINHFKGKSAVRDLDNFEYKYFIDSVIVGGGFIPDDNPNYLVLLSIRSKENSDKSYTEAVLGDVSEVLRLVENQNELENGNTTNE